MLQRNLITTIFDRSNEKLRPPLPPFQSWKNGAFCFAGEFIIDFEGRGGGLIFHFNLAKVVAFKLTNQPTNQSTNQVADFRYVWMTSCVKSYFLLYK